MGGFGYGGFGGMYGMGMGMGMMGMQGMENGMIRQGIQVMESINFMVCSMGQIARSMEANANGFGQLFSSVKGMGQRVQSPFKRAYSWVKRILLQILDKVLVLMKIRE